MACKLVHGCDAFAQSHVHLSLTNGICLSNHFVQHVFQCLAAALDPANLFRAFKSSGIYPYSFLGQSLIENASVVVMNFTLQFIAVEERHALIERIYQGLKPGGVLILSEKLAFDDQNQSDFLVNAHHDFKRDNGYSDLEISQKRTALENVMIPETLACHQQRLTAAGFGFSSVWFQCFNFASMVAVK